MTCSRPINLTCRSRSTSRSGRTGAICKPSEPATLLSQFTENRLDGSRRNQTNDRRAHWWPPKTPAGCRPLNCRGRDSAPEAGRSRRLQHQCSHGRGGGDPQENGRRRRTRARLHRRLPTMFPPMAPSARSKSPVLALSTSGWPTAGCNSRSQQLSHARRRVRQHRSRARPALAGGICQRQPHWAHPLWRRTQRRVGRCAGECARRRPVTKSSASIYVNDAGTQFDAFAATLYARYAQLLGREEPLPAEGYQANI